MTGLEFATFLDFIVLLFTNKITLSLIITFIITELTKILFDFWKTKKFVFANLYHGGGMPSSHSSLVSALTFSILFNLGFSIMWVAVFIFSLVIVRDSFGVRRHAGEQARVLNMVLKDSKNLKYRGMLGRKKLQEHIGHKPIETIVGVIFGLVISIVISLI
jgi:uncharacterized protein